MKYGDKMKIKPLYIYLIVFAVFIAAFIIFSGNGDKTSNPHEGMGQMPNDDVHKGIGSGQNPSSSNVTESAKKKLEDLKTSYEKNPKDTLTAREYAEMLSMAHQPEKAIEIYQNILSTDSKRSDIMLDLTFLYYNKGDFDKAESYTKSMLALDANNPYAFFNLAIIEHAKGDIPRAKKQLEETIKKFPGMQIAKDAQQLLDEINNTKK